MQHTASFTPRCTMLRQVFTKTQAWARASAISARSVGKCCCVPHRCRHELAADTHTVDSSWLVQRLKQVDVLDASWYMPAAKRDTYYEYLAGHIPGARFFDIDKLADTTVNLPHMLPSEEQFTQIASEMGLSHDRSIVVYDTAGIFSAPRVWWMLRAFGHRHVAVLSGGLPEWQAAGKPVESGPPRQKHAPAALEKWALDRRMVASKAEVARDSAAIVGSMQRGAPPTVRIVDARSAERFTGAAPEPRPGLPSGHMPGACNVPFGAVLQSGGARLRPKEELERVFRAAGIDCHRESRIVTSCGSGMTAAVLYLALTEAGRKMESTALYDGSWTEWASDPAAPKEVGPSKVLPLK